ncbi:hypothetical protein HZS_5721 [Henneguya salminicola]|nr:hypothetical protein HZS_5721 [Henneguya salminicola]
MLGKIEIFDPENTSWKSYLEQFENWIFLNDIPEEKQSRTLLALVGPKTYEIVKTAALGKNINELPKEVIIEIIGNHFNPSPLIMAERFKFWSTRQEPEEPLRDYVLKDIVHGETKRD